VPTALNKDGIKHIESSDRMDVGATEHNSEASDNSLSGGPSNVVKEAARSALTAAEEKTNDHTSQMRPEHSYEHVVSNIAGAQSEDVDTTPRKLTASPCLDETKLEKDYDQFGEVQAATSYQDLESLVKAAESEDASERSADIRSSSAALDLSGGYSDSGRPRQVKLPSPSDSPQVGPSLPTSKSNKRRGKWTIEEESYVARVIQDFNSGFLDAPAGTTLRTYLSDKLQCDPMRITKKFTGDSCIGKRVFHPAVRSPSNATGIDNAQVDA
jgi:hypothetical protein